MTKCFLGGLTLMMLLACQEQMPQAPPVQDEPMEYGGGLNFKVPVQAGFNWEVSQSWSSHCKECELRYPDWDYCSLSHTGQCCDHSYDFNLPGPADSGKPVLASADGFVADRGFNSGWGNYVLLNHGQNICSRYAHMIDGSTSHLQVNQRVCQGLRLGGIGDTGASEGSHLHFQFENCETGETLPMGFDDGNGIPMCTRGRDVFDQNGDYNFLILSNEVKESCGPSTPVDQQEDLPEGGWVSNSCGSLVGCPLIPNCGRGFNHQFSDHHFLEPRTATAALYLWSECALDGKADGAIYQYDWLTRAEALKIALFLFGLNEDCGLSVNYHDVEPEAWYFPIVACGIRYQIISTVVDLFYPNREATFAEAAKMVSKAAQVAGVIELQQAASGHFPQIPAEHWAHIYLETLYSYGALVKSPGEVEPEALIQRGQYIQMAAALSPCYCPNVQCDVSCVCEQSLYACVDPNDQDPGVGGGLSEEPDAALPEPEPEIEYDDPDVGVMAEPDQGLPDMQPIELDAALPEPEPDALVREVPVDARVIPDAAIPRDQMVQEEEPEICYSIHLAAPGGTMELLLRGGDSSRHQFPQNNGIFLELNCNEIPAMIYLHPRPGTTAEANVVFGARPFEGWIPYHGPIRSDPPNQPNFNGISARSEESLLLRIPRP